MVAHQSDSRVTLSNASSQFLRAKARAFLRIGALSRSALVALAFSTMVGCGGGDGLSTGTGQPIVIIVSPQSATIAEERTVKLSAAVQLGTQPAPNGKVSWTSSNTAVATVVDSGLVTGVAPGVVTITAKASTGEIASAQITVVTSPCKASEATPIVANTLVNGTLAFSDCDYGDGTYLDAYSFQLTSSTNVDILMRSTAFDAYLYVYALTAVGVEERANDNNSGGGTDARLTGLLTAGTYFILANSNNVNGFGPYTLLLTSPFAGLNAASMFGHETGAPVLRRLSPLESLKFRTQLKARH